MVTVFFVIEGFHLNSENTCNGNEEFMEALEMIGLLNIGSLVLGLIAWILPVVNLLCKKSNSWMTLSIISICACAISLCFQIFYTYHKVTIEDWSALMDTMYTTAYASAALLLITIVLNVMTFVVYRGKT
jgi:hypothetical protein